MKYLVAPVGMGIFLSFIFFHTHLTDTYLGEYELQYPFWIYIWENHYILQNTPSFKGFQDIINVKSSYISNADSNHK